MIKLLIQHKFFFGGCEEGSLEENTEVNDTLRSRK